MIELPSTPKAKPVNELKRVNARPIIVMPCNSAEVVENVHEIVEKLQLICCQMNSYFGKKVRREFAMASTTTRFPLQVIFTLLSAFICLTVQLFYLINNIRQGFPSEKSMLAAAASCSLIFTHVLELWVIFIGGHRVKDMWSDVIKRVQETKRKFAADERFKAQIDELVSIMVFTRIEMKAAGLFNIDLSVITSVSADCRRRFGFDN